MSVSSGEFEENTPESENPRTPTPEWFIERITDHSATYWEQLFCKNVAQWEKGKSECIVSEVVSDDIGRVVCMYLNRTFPTFSFYCKTTMAGFCGMVTYYHIMCSISSFTNKYTSKVKSDTWNMVAERAIGMSLDTVRAEIREKVAAWPKCARFIVLIKTDDDSVRHVYRELANEMLPGFSCGSMYDKVTCVGLFSSEKEKELFLYF